MYDNQSLRNITEKDIQQLYFRHPYLIDPRFENYQPTQFYRLSSGYADLVLFLNNTIIVIELKIDHLRKTHVLQVAQYTKEFQEKFSSKQVESILIGQTPEVDLTPLLQTFDFRVKIKILNQDVPVNIKICAGCRNANNYSNVTCWKCQGEEWMQYSE